MVKLEEGKASAANESVNSLKAEGGGQLTRPYSRENRGGRQLPFSLSSARPTHL